MDSKEITLICILKNPGGNRLRSRLLRYERMFGQVIVLSRQYLEENAHVSANILCESDEDLVPALNRACSLVTSSWILWLEEDEEVSETELAKLAPERSEFCMACFTEEFPEPQRRFHDLRLLPFEVCEEEVFTGVVPDATDHVFSRNLSPSRQVLRIRKKGKNIRPEKPEAAAGREAKCVMDWYWKGIWFSEKQRFLQAENSFRRALRSDRLLPAWKLASMNGLANALLETNRAEDALIMARRSEAAESRQFAPYLIRHKVHWRKGEWKAAREALEDYLRQSDQCSASNLDFWLEPSEAHYLMAELSFSLNESRRAFGHLETFYRLNGGQVSEEVKDRLYVYAVKLKKEKKAVRYFHALFGNLPEEMNRSPERSRRILGAISLLEEQGWNRSACALYEKLMKLNPEHQKIMRRWLVAMMQSDQLDRARELAGAAAGKGRNLAASRVRESSLS